MRVVVVTMMLLLCAGCQEQRMISEAKESVRAGLKDPESAQFRDVAVVVQRDGSRAVCGEVNAKNSLGGYVGFTYFDYSPDRKVSRLMPANVSHPFDKATSISIQLTCLGGQGKDTK